MMHVTCDAELMISIFDGRHATQLPPRDVQRHSSKSSTSCRILIHSPEKGVPFLR